MGIQDLQAFLESGDVEGSCVGVDLVRIARSQSRVNQVLQPPVKPHGKKASASAAIANVPASFSLVIDAECCLDRLYGGYFSDWVCGGQWNRVTTFLGQFISSLKASNIELAVFFNGCTEPQRTDEWIAEQLRRRAKISQVLRHLVNKGTPPPKVWWTPPSCLKPTLRLVLRNLSVPVFVTMDDHKQEVIAYCRENGCHALVADDGEYIAFNPPRYFSARHLKLTYKGTLESKEYIISELSKSLQLSVDQLCILAALLGNFLLPEFELSDLHKKLNLEPPVKSKDGTSVESNPIEAVKAVAAFVRSLQNKELDDLGTEIFGAVGGERAAKFKQAVQYYKDGTKSGFLRFRPYSHKKNRKNKNGEKSEPQTPTNTELNLDTSGFASEANDEGLSALMSTKEVMACLSVSGQESDPVAQESVESPNNEKVEEKPGNGTTLSADASSSSSGATSPSRTPSQADTSAQPSAPQIKQKKQVRLLVEDDQLDRRVTLPNIASEVMRTVSERHTKGLMSPLIYQILTQGEVKLPVVMEDESFKELSIGIQQFYKPLRQMLYAILFNLNHLTYLARHSKQQNKESGEHHGHHGSKVPDIKVKEWVWTKQNPYERPELTKAEPLGWGVPTVQRLWFGTTVDDKRRRLRTYLTVMRSDTHLMLNPSYVPQHLLVLATVLRYIMSGEKKLLRKHELDAIIAMAFDPNLANCDFNQDLQIQVECVTPRGVQLGALIMTGIEYALVVNDACGAPIPWLMTCPWLFFDGKLLHSTLARASTVKNLLELCEHRIPQVMKVETMREAILEGVYVQWARPNLIQGAVNGRPMGRDEVHQVMPAGMNSRGVFRGGPVQSGMRGQDPSIKNGFEQYMNYSDGYGCGCIHDIGEGFRYVNTLSYYPFAPRIRMTTGGRLEIAGVVVGNWGPNCRLHPNPNFMMAPPQVTSVGGFNGGMRPNKGGPYNHRNGPVPRAGKGRPTAGKTSQGKKKSGSGSGKKDAGRKHPRARGLTAVSPFTGKNVGASELLAQDSAHEEKKMILTNSDKKIKEKIAPATGNAQLVNGEGHSDDAAGAGDVSPPPKTDADDIDLSDLMASAKINGDCEAEVAE